MSLERVQKVFKNCFNVDDVSIEAKLGEIEGWDSFGHVALMTAIEKEFSMKISLAKSQEMRSVKKIVDIIDNAH